MQMHQLPGSELTVSTFCLGGGNVGTVVRGDDLDRLIDAFREAGGNFFDTAHCYSYWIPNGTGASELAFADYFRRHGGTKGMVIGTKGGIPSVKGYRKVDQYLSPRRIGADIDDSLGRLDIDTIDLYWLHRDDPRLTVGEIIDTLNAEIRRGRIRYLGASNWTCKRVAAANAYAAEHGLRGFAAIQPEWCLAYPNAQVRDDTLHFFDDHDAAWCRKEKLLVVPYTPTAGGYFATGGKAAQAGFDNDISRARLRRAEKLAAELGCTPHQVAIAYLMSHDFPVIPILGTSKPDHLHEAFGAAKLRLSPAQILWLLNG